MIPFRWETRHLRPQRAAGQPLPGAPPMATHYIDLVVRDGTDEARQHTLPILDELRFSLAQISDVMGETRDICIAGAQDDSEHTGQWCVSWDT